MGKIYSAHLYAKPINFLCHPWQQELQSNISYNWQYVFHIAVEEF